MNIPERFWKAATIFVFVLIAAAAVCMIAVLKSINYIGANRNQTDTITVNGTGDAYAIPDVATFSFTVTDTEKAVADAQVKVTDEVNAALAVVRAAGVADKDIQTQYYSINPHYDYQNAVCPMIASQSGAPIYCPPGKQTLTGYDVSESVSVKLRDLSKAGALLASLGSAGVENLSGPSFAVDNPDSVQAEARGKAIADAQSKAAALAGQLGVSLVRITSFSDNNGSYPGPIMYAMGAVATPSSKAAPAPEVPTGQQKVTDTVTITYEIR